MRSSFQMTNIASLRSVGVWILGLSFMWPVACTRTEDSTPKNSGAKAVDSVAGAESTLEPSTPEGAPGSVESVGSCNIEMLNDQAATEKPWELPLNSRLRLDGWVVDESNPKRAPEQLFIVLQDVASGSRWNARVSSRFPRPDVVKAKNSALMSGFRAGFDILNLPRGEYRVLLAFWQDGPLKLCDVGRRVLVE